MEPAAYLNDRFLPQSEARLTLHDAGFVFGATATDLCRTFRHVPFRLPDHLRRFRQSCSRAQIPLPVSDDQLAALAHDLVGRNARLLGPDQDLALVLLATPGPIGYYLGEPGGPGDGPPTLVLHTFPLPFARYRPLFEEGARLVVPSVRHVPAASVDPRIKQRSRLHWWLAEREAHCTEPGAAALLLDEHGHFTETAGANFLLVRGGAVHTPPRTSILGGVSLQVVQELCAELGVAFEERPLTVADCLGADEAWLSSTPYCLAGVRRINGVDLPWPGPLYQRLLACWGEMVQVDIAGQVVGSARRASSPAK